MVTGCASMTGLSALPAVGRAAANADGMYLRRMGNFDADYDSDLLMDAQQYPLLKSVVSRLKRVQGTVGYGNFHMLGFDGMLKIARGYSSVGRFTPTEIAFIEKIFYIDAREYGFFGDKVRSGLTDEVAVNETVKVRGRGQRLFKGESLAKYKAMRNAIGTDLILTSGVRSVAKQCYLFLNKAKRTKGNLSRASRQLAPPGYSFHATGDFDVGKKRFGRLNFTRSFADSDVYARLVDLGFVEHRYPMNNALGVRFEPWHVKIHHS